MVRFDQLFEQLIGFHVWNFLFFIHLGTALYEAVAALFIGQLRNKSDEFGFGTIVGVRLEIFDFFIKSKFCFN
jgi:hypothetical protein